MLLMIGGVHEISIVLHILSTQRYSGKLWEESYSAEYYRTTYGESKKRGRPIGMEQGSLTRLRLNKF